MWQKMVSIFTTRLPRFTVEHFHEGDFVEQARRPSANCDAGGADRHSISHLCLG